TTRVVCEGDAEAAGDTGRGAGAGRSRIEGIQVENESRRTAATRGSASHPMMDQPIKSLAPPRAQKSHAWWNAGNGWLLLMPAALPLAAFMHYRIVAGIR